MDLLLSQIPNDVSVKISYLILMKFKKNSRHGYEVKGWFVEIRSKAKMEVADG